MSRSLRPLICIGLLMVCAIGGFNPPVLGQPGQDSVFDEPLVTGESSGDPLADGDDLMGDQPVDPREEFERLMSEAEALMQQSNWAAAVEAYNQILAQFRHPRAQLNQGICFKELGAIELAISSIAMAIITPGASAEEGLVEQAYSIRGELYTDTGRYREAIDDFTQAVQINPSNPGSHFLLGRALVRLVVTSPGGGMDQGGQASLMQAVKSLERAVSLKPDYGEAYLERGRALFRLRQIEYAIEDLQQAVKLLGSSSEASADLGVAYSFRASQESFETEPDDAAIIQDMRSSIDSLNAYLDTARLGERTPPWEVRDPMKTRPEKVMLSRGDTRISLANELQTEEREELLRSALTDADTMLRHDIEEDDEGRAHFVRGSALRLLDDLDAAIVSFTRAIQAYESLGAPYSEAYLRRGICYYYQQKFDSALQDFRSASVIPSNPFSDEPRAMLWKGIVHAQRGEFEDAIRSYTRSLQSSPRYLPAYMNRGLAYMNVGRNERALEDFVTIIRIDPENAQAIEYRKLAMQGL